MKEDAKQAAPVPSVYERLAAQFPTEDHKRVKKGGREQTYIPWTDKVERFNEVLGHDWSFRVVREGLTDTEAWVLGELSVTIDGVTTVRQQYGCESITRGQSASPVTDLFKIAGTDALSKAATLFGCGLYLSIQEERAEVEAAMQAAVRAAAEERRPKAPAGNAATTAAAPGTKGSPSASTPPASSASRTSSSTTATPVKSTPEVEASAQLTGAPRQPAGYFCVECSGLVKTDGAVTIPKKKGGPMVPVPVTDFAPVCIERLGEFHCPGCYEKKWFGAA